MRSRQHLSSTKRGEHGRRNIVSCEQTSTLKWQAAAAVPGAVRLGIAPAAGIPTAAAGSALQTFPAVPAAPHRDQRRSSSATPQGPGSSSSPPHLAAVRPRGRKRSEGVAGGSGGAAAGPAQPHPVHPGSGRTHLGGPHDHGAPAGRGKRPRQAAAPGLPRWAALGGRQHWLTAQSRDHSHAMGLQAAGLPTGFGTQASPMRGLRANDRCQEVQLARSLTWVGRHLDGLKVPPRRRCRCVWRLLQLPVCEPDQRSNSKHSSLPWLVDLPPLFRPSATEVQLGQCARTRSRQVLVPASQYEIAQRVSRVG